MALRNPHELTDPALKPLLTWIDSYVSWEKLSERVRSDLARRAHLGDEGAIEAMTNHNLRLVLSRACKKMGRGVPLADLIQEGWLGLRLAVQKYDLRRVNPKTGRPHEFSTMATHWIDQKLRYAIITQGRTIYLPHHASEKLGRIGMRMLRGEAISASDQLWMDRLAREISGNPNLHDVTIYYFDHLIQTPISIDKPVVQQTHGGAEKQHTLADLLPAPGNPDPSDALDFGVLLPQLVNRGVLRPRDAWMLIRFYGLDGEGGRSMPEIAQELFDAERRAGVNLARTQPIGREAVRQCLVRGIHVLRDHLNASEARDAAISPYTLPTATVNGTLKGQTKRPSVPQSPAKVKSTESPKARSVRHTSVDSSSETAASRSAAPTPLRANSSTKRAKGSSRSTRKSSGLDVQYPEAI